MARRLPLDDGGSFYHDARPAGFHPALRAAAQLLLAAERRAPGLRAGLRRRCAGGAMLDLEAVAAPTVWFDPGRGLCIARGVHSRAGRRRLRARLEPAQRVARWARRRHLAGVWVVELLLLTVAAWQELEAPAHARRAAASWGPWVELLASPPETADATLLLELSARRTLPYLRRARRARPGGRLLLELDGWDVETETWEGAETRLRAQMETALLRHRRRTERRVLASGYRPCPTRTAGHHFDWLALRQIAGWGPARLARRFGVGTSAVSRGVARVAALLELPLRPLSPGPGGG